MYTFTKKLLARMLFSLVVLLGSFTHSFSQCDPSNTAPVAFTGVTITDEICPQNGTITINGVTGGGGEYSYEIFDGPVVRAIQSQNVFAALTAGSYKIRITGCNGKFKEVQAVIAAKYRRFSSPYLSLVPNRFKCGVINDGMVVLNQIDNFPNGTPGDEALLKTPFRYQVTTNSDPYTGFDGVPYRNFTRPVVYESNGTFTNRIEKDTLKNLLAGQTYYVRVTDQCGVFITTSIVMPQPDPAALSFNFVLKDPYNRSSPSGSTSGIVNYLDCVQWGELTVLANGTPVTTLSQDNANLPLTVTIKRQDNGSTITTRTISYLEGIWTIDSLHFDSIPRVPVTVEVKNACGTAQTFTFNTPLPLSGYNIQAFNQCSPTGNFFQISAYNGVPTTPIHFKIYNDANSLIIDKMIDSLDHYNNQVVMLQPGVTGNAGTYGSIVPAYGTYHLVYIDNCGRKDSITHTFAPGTGSAVAPAFNFETYNTVCTSNNLFVQNFTQTKSSPVQSAYLISGPAGITYPKYAENTVIRSNMGSIGTAYFDSLVVGTYHMQAKYGCGQVFDTVFTVSTALTTPPVNAVMTWNPAEAACAASLNGQGSLQANVSIETYKAALLDYPYIRITQAPSSYLQKIAHSKTGGPVTIPLNLGNLEAVRNPSDEGISSNGIDTNTVNVYPLYTFRELGNSFNNTLFDPGTYTFEMYGHCSNNVITTLTFTVYPPRDTPLNLGASAAYLCDNRTDVKLVAGHSGGIAPFRYQIKQASASDVSYSALQTDSVFVLPASTSGGAVFTLRIVDSCGKSFVGEVPVNDFTGKFYIIPYNNCLEGTMRVITGFIPGATYTWTKPNGTTIVTKSNELNIINFTAADKGTYSVTINALNGCIVRTATGVISEDCTAGGPLPVKLTWFTARKNAENNVDVKWQTSMEMNSKHFEVQRSTDAVHYSTIAIVNSRAPGGSSAVTLNYSMEDATANALNATQIYYRLQQVDLDGKSALSKVETVRFNGVNDINVYPNPLRAGEILNIKGLKLGETIRLVNVTGQIIISQKANSVVAKINLPMLKPGVYHLQVTSTDGGVITKKIILL